MLKDWEAEFGTTPPVTVTGLPTTVAVPVHVEPVKKLYVTVPPAWKPPVMVAVSNTEPPTVICVTERLVVMVGATLLTVRVSPVAPQVVATALLLPSPLYPAMKKYVPAVDGVKAADGLPSGILAEVKTRVVQAASL